MSHEMIIYNNIHILGDLSSIYIVIVLCKIGGFKYIYYKVMGGKNIVLNKIILYQVGLVKMLHQTLCLSICLKYFTFYMYHYIMVRK